MVNSKNDPGNYKTLKISLETIMKNPKVLRFVSDHLKAKKMRKNAVKKSPFAICSRSI